MAALHNIEDDKAPNPNEFPIKFVKTCEEFVEKEVIATLEAFY